MTQIYTATFPFPSNAEAAAKLASSEWIKDGRLHTLEAVKLQTSYREEPFQLWTKGDTRDPLPLDRKGFSAELQKMGEIPQLSRLQTVIFEFNDKNTAMLFQLTHGGR